MRSTRVFTILTLGVGLIACVTRAGEAVPMGTAFTYQGQLMDANYPAEGLYDFEFRLYDSNDPCTGVQLGETIGVPDLDVIGGLFVVELDFGSDVFDGKAVWLETRIMRSPLGSEPAAMRPLIEMTPVPYALHTQGIVVGTNNTFAGNFAGYSNTTGNRNTFMGTYAGYYNTSGYRNTFLGNEAGYNNTTAWYNTFVGFAAGRSNTEGNHNTFLGYYAGKENTKGYDNTFVGYNAGYSNTTGRYNTILGLNAGYNNDEGNGNVFIGHRAGFNETGSNKLYIANSAADPPLIYGDFSTGNIGIGTTSPAGKLTIAGPEDTDLITFEVSDADRFSIAVHSSGPDYMSIKSKFEDPNLDIITFRGNGNVGIGTPSPQGKLEVSHDGESHDLVVSSTGDVGIGTTDPNQKLHVTGPGGGFFEATGSAGIAVKGVASSTETPMFGSSYGGYFEARAPKGTGVVGWASNSEPYDNCGGCFTADSLAGTGVYGRGGLYGGHFKAQAGNGQGVYGEASNDGGSTNYGGYFKAAGTYGRGVYGYATSTDGYGVYGYADNNGDVTNYGGYFEAAGKSGYGAYGKASGSDGAGVYGEATGTSGTAVYGYGPIGGYDFYAGGPGVDYGYKSSVRWKNNIQAIDDPLGKVQKLRGVYFDWDAEHGGGRDVGMLAEEVGQVLPEIVGYEENGIDATGMDYGKLTPLLIEAVKALKEQSDKQQEQLAEKSFELAQHRKQIQELQNQVAQLQHLMKKVAEWK
jgi:hypothetical protein